MTILSDREIIKLCKNHQMITPFFDKNIAFERGSKVLSYGLSSYGYDARLGDQFKIFNPKSNKAVDPKNFSDCLYEDINTSEPVTIPPNGFILAKTLERFIIPRDVLSVCLGKSTYARCGLIVNVTPLEPEWQGHVTLEISNTSSLPAIVYPYEGVCQFLFFRASKMCRESYADKNGKYQNQEGVCVPRM